MNIKPDRKQSSETKPLPNSVASENKIGFQEVANTVGSMAGGILVGVGLGGPVGAAIGGIVGAAAAVATANATSQHQKLSVSNEEGQ